MPKVPDIDQAMIDPRKITAHLLDPTHPQGGPKSVFFPSFGFRADQPHALAAALLAHGRSHDAASVQVGSHGTKFTVRGILLTPTGRTPVVRTVWIIDAGASVRRFVTAVPDRI
jgi:hypothetical protein